MATPDFIERVVTSTRIRLARNLAGYPFPEKLDETLAEEVLYILEKNLLRLDDFEKQDLSTLTKEQLEVLQERHLISPALIKKRMTAAAFLSSDHCMSIMVNEEDHLREQYICKGFDLFKAYERISALDEGLGAHLQFAYDEKLGYLTACPSNVGTGMRASVMMFLPALAKSNELQAFLPTLKQSGLTVRGVFGEGTAAEGYNYQVSNERTLGMSEIDILDQMTRTTMQLCDMELRCRERMLKEEHIALKDECLRAFGVLTNCALLSYRELAESMVKVKLGIVLGFFKTRNIRHFNDFMSDMRPATFRLENDLQDKKEYDCDLMRAEIMRKVLPELVTRVD